ncbi:hypothetical protein [Bradyrhizobium sp. 27S5]|uniref:hypothetical protein n=1 Tax=Bradyrhizobium sp. 27S5 TaxID=3139728 RepID=UPI0030D2158F
MQNKNPATKGGAVSVGDLLGGDLPQNTASPLTLQATRIMSRFATPVATAFVLAELAYAGGQS